MSEVVEQSKTLRLIRLEKAEIDALLDILDGQTATPDKSGRKIERYSYRTLVNAHIQQPGSGHSLVYRVPTRNLSEEGLSWLHGGFLHIGTQCTLQLMTPQGTWCDVTGSVLWCRYVQNGIHEVALKFDHPIDPALFCASAIRPRVLLAEDSSVIARLAMYHLQKLNADCTHVKNGQEAIDLAMKSPYDIILLDMDLPVLDGFEVARRLREKRYVGTIVAATGMTQPEDREKCLTAGCDRYIPKPYGEKDIAELIETVGEEPMYSTLCNDHSMSGLIESFISQLAATVRELEEALAAADIKRISRIAREMKGEGTGYGFEAISQKSADIEHAVIGGARIEELEQNVRALIKLCLRVRSSTRSI